MHIPRITAGTTVILTAASLTAASAMTGFPAALAASSSPRSEVAFPAVSGELYGIAATSARNAWAVGNTGTYLSGNPLIMHWNGDRWSEVPSPDPPGGGLLTSVTATSPASAWAVGYTNNLEPLIVGWNGTQWAQVPSPEPPGGAELTAVSATTATNAWAVGCSACSGSRPRTLILHWNGAVWARVPSPDPSPAMNSLSEVIAVSARSAWAAGDAGISSLTSGTRTLILRWNGKSWARVRSPDPGNRFEDDSVTAVAQAPHGGAWAVGVSFRDSPRSFILRWDGSAWQKVPSPGYPGGSTLSGVVATAGGKAWAVGSIVSIVNESPSALILRWNGKAWARYRLPALGSDTVLSAVAANSGTSAWAVGGTGLSKKILILRWNGTTWT